MGAHIGHEHAHLTGRAIDLHTRAIVALQGQLGFEVDARHVSAEELAQLQHYVGLYKKHRPWIAQCRSYRLDCKHTELFQSGLVSEDKSQSLWFAIATQSLEPTTPGKFKPVGLSADKVYKVALASLNAEHFKTFSKHVPNWVDNSIEVHGDVLMKLGLTLPVMPVQSALLIEITSQ